MVYSVLSMLLTNKNGIPINRNNRVENLMLIAILHRYFG